MTESIGVHRFIDNAIAVTDLDGIKSNSGGDTGKKCRLCIGALTVDDFEQMLGAVDLDDGLVIETVYGAVAALTEDLFALNADLAQGFFDIKNTGKACNIKNFIYVNTDVIKRHISDCL